MNSLRAFFLAVSAVGLAGARGNAQISFRNLDPTPAPQPSGCLWQSVSPVPQARTEGVGAVIGDELFVFGGFINSSLHTTGRVDVYHPTSDSWRRVSDMPVQFTHSPPAVDGTDVYFAGGFIGNHPGPATAQVWKYDALADTWTPRTSLPSPRAGGALVRFNRTLHYFGGVLADRQTNSANHWTLDIDQGTSWNPAAPLPQPRNHLSGARLGPRIYAIGGQFGHDSNPTDVDFVHIYNPFNDTWERVASLPFPRSHFEPGTLTLDGRIAIAGGRSLGQLGLIDFTVYDPISDAWSAGPSLPSALFAPVVQPVGELLVLTAGGPAVNMPRSDTYVREATVDFPVSQRFNAGGGSYLSMTSSVEWCPDAYFVDGMSFTNNQVQEVLGTQDDELFRTERTGSNANPSHVGYRVAVTNGAYRVRLHFAEIFWGAPGGGPGGAGRRVFDVALEGQTVLQDLDIYAQAGGAAAAIHFTFNTIVSDGDLDIDLTASIDRPKVSAIEIRRL